MILIKDMHGKSHFCYADKSIPPARELTISAELIAFRRDEKEASNKPYRIGRVVVTPNGQR